MTSVRNHPNRPLLCNLEGGLVIDDVEGGVHDGALHLLEDGLVVSEEFTAGVPVVQVVNLSSLQMYQREKYIYGES